MTKTEISSFFEVLIDKLQQFEYEYETIQGILPQFKILVQKISGPDSEYIKIIEDLQNSDRNVSQLGQLLWQHLVGYQELIDHKVIQQGEKSNLFIAESTISDLSALASVRFDTKRLVALCRELNLCYFHGANHAVAMLIRSIVDHVPPIFGFKNFSEVANNYSSASQSFKKAMLRLDQGARTIADLYLHRQIMDKESVITTAQVAYGPEVDLLMQEVLRVGSRS